MKWHDEAEAEKAKVDLTPWLKMSAEEIHEDLCNIFEKYPWAVDGKGGVSPKGHAYHEALLSLRDEKREYEQICEWMDKAGLKFYIDDITNISRTSTVYAECGCCAESGGDYTVFLNDRAIEFDRYGSLIKKEPTPQRFSWLRKDKK